ncbi:hypothetical protein PR048_010617 [Dryococelus australis]|uniref:General transcription factor II-I repeat domain-containing protein 2 n=1 Tax=Dryococelus australis TaxID=614101 RepID=A0ABQ9I376_9NEOP|nr:hypothetical protein PR048_010617 [Dryococelus australis]
MEGKGKLVAEFADDEWTCEFAFLVDITTHLNELNLRLQEVYFSDSQKYYGIISELMEQFDTRFQDFKKNTASFNLYSFPFSTSIDDVPENLQMECVSLQCDKFNNFSLLDFYKKYVSQETYLRIHKHAILMTSLFGSTYLCEQVFYRLKHVQCTSRSRITDVHLESSQRVATSSIMSDIGKLIGGKQCQARLLSPVHTGASAVCSLADIPHLAVMGFARCFLASLLLTQRRVEQECVCGSSRRTDDPCPDTPVATTSGFHGTEPGLRMTDVEKQGRGAEQDYQHEASTAGETPRVGRVMNTVGTRGGGRVRVEKDFISCSELRLQGAVTPRVAVKRYRISGHKKQWWSLEPKSNLEKGGLPPTYSRPHRGYKQLRGLKEGNQRGWDTRIAATCWLQGAAVKPPLDSPPTGLFQEHGAPTTLTAPETPRQISQRKPSVFSCFVIVMSPSLAAVASPLCHRPSSGLNLLKDGGRESDLLIQRYDGNTARRARRSDEEVGVSVTVARIVPSLLDPGRGGQSHSLRTPQTWCFHGRLACSPPTTVIRVQSRPDFRMRGSCWMVPLVGGVSSGISRFPQPCVPELHRNHPRFTLIGSRDIDVEGRQNLFAHSLTLQSTSCFNKTVAHRHCTIRSSEREMLILSMCIVERYSC